MKTTIPFVLALFLAACGTTMSPPIPYGKDSFKIDKTDSGGFAAPSTLAREVAIAANVHCASKGKVIKVLNTHESGRPAYTPTTANIIYSCIDEDSPQNQPPRLRKEPDISIRSEQ